jgi:hypothetical protein
MNLRPTKIIACASLLAVLSALVASCSSNDSAASSEPPANSPAASSSSPTAPTSTAPAAATGPTTFTSATYGYSISVPAGWTAEDALKAWDGTYGLDIEAPAVDKFLGNSTASAWAASGPWDQNLAAYSTYLVEWNKRYHSNTCPPKPETKSRVGIGGRPGILLDYNCGILINMAATVDHGVGYVFLLRDPGVASATDPKDSATFARMLNSVRFPH